MRHCLFSTILMERRVRHFFIQTSRRRRQASWGATQQPPQTALISLIAPIAPIALIVPIPPLAPIALIATKSTSQTVALQTTHQLMQTMLHRHLTCPWANTAEIVTFALWRLLLTKQTAVVASYLVTRPSNTATVTVLRTSPYTNPRLSSTSPELYIQTNRWL